MNSVRQDKRVLAIDLRSRSFGFAVFEGPTRLLDWGIKSFRQGVNTPKIPAHAKFIGLLDEFSPSAIVLRTPVRDSEKSGAMRRELLGAAEKNRIPIRLLSRRAVMSAFPGCSRNKHAIAATLCKYLPELASRLPNARKIWESEDYRMSIFDAAALGVAYFHRSKPSPKASIETKLAEASATAWENAHRRKEYVAGQLKL